METMTNELTVIPRTIGMMGRMGMLKPEFIEDAVIVSEEEQEEHPNFIESNTSGITLEELERNCIVPSFGDNQLTISHQKFIHQVEDAALWQAGFGCCFSENADMSFNNEPEEVIILQGVTRIENMAFQGYPKLSAFPSIPFPLMRLSSTAVIPFGY